MTIIHNLGMFLLGIRDSMSLSWIPNILFCVDPISKKMHPSSKKMQNSLNSSFVQVIIFMLGVPFLLQLVGIKYIALLLKTFFLLLSYGYLYFHNQDILASTRQIVAWKQRKAPRTNFELDARQNIELFTLLSGQIKGFVFLVFYYVPILLIATIFSFVPYLGMGVMIVSEAFFNGAFYFLSTWPYDKYNAAFIEKQLYYMVGYGMFVSIVCNYFLTGFTSLGVGLLLSLWMLTNSVIFSPVQTEFKSTQEIWKALSNVKFRNLLPNAYNVHRKKLRTQKNYRTNLIKKTVFLVNPALKITQWLNERLSLLIRQRNDQNNKQQKAQTNKKQFKNQQQYFESIPFKLDEDDQQDK